MPLVDMHRYAIGSREIAELRMLLGTAEVAQAEAEEDVSALEARNATLESQLAQARAAKGDLLDEVGDLTDEMARVQTHVFRGNPPIPPFTYTHTCKHARNGGWRSPSGVAPANMSAHTHTHARTHTVYLSADALYLCMLTYVQYR